MVSSIKKLALLTKDRKVPAYAKASAGKPAYAKASAGKPAYAKASAGKHGARSIASIINQSLGY